MINKKTPKKKGPAPREGNRPTENKDYTANDAARDAVVNYWIKQYGDLAELEHHLENAVLSVRREKARAWSKWLQTEREEGRASWN